MPDLLPTRMQYDAEAGDVVEVTPDLVHQHAALHRMADRATLAKAVVYREIAERRTFLAAGCSSFREYIEDVRGESYAGARMYLRVGRQFGGLLAGGDGAAQTVGLLTSGDAECQSNNTLPSLDGAPALEGLGIFKLDELARLLDADDVEHLRQTSEIRLPSGKTLTLDELQQMTQAEAKREFAAERKALRDRAADLAERLKLAVSERDAMADKITDAEARAADADAKEALYGPTGRRVAEMRKHLQDARTRLDEFRAVLVRAGVTLDATPEMQDHLREVVAYLRRTLRDMTVHYLDVVQPDAEHADDLTYTDEADA